MVKAIAVLKGDSPVKGIVTIEQSGESSPVKITGELSGMDANAERGFHVHVFGDNSNGCTSAGPHWNPSGKKHGAPDAEERHAGDLGNLKTDGSGNVSLDITDKQLTLFGSESIIGPFDLLDLVDPGSPHTGRTIVVHAGTDDLGQGGNEESFKTGNAGGRAACGVIGIAG